MSIKFSIITPVYNREDCILNCLNSVRSQSYNNYEHIIIDDGSSDNTLERIHQFSLDNKTIIPISYSENKGVNYARNKGIQAATGDYVIFLDSDDYFLDNALTLVSEYINSNSNYLHYLFLNDDGRKDRNYSDFKKEINYSDWLDETISGDFAHVVKTSILKANLFNEEFRIFEILNWMKIFRLGKKQLLVPEYITHVEIDRIDSVTRESILDNKLSMKNNFDYLYYFINWYGPDYRALGLTNILQAHIRKGVLLGFALGESERNINMLNQMECGIMKKRFYEVLNKIPVNAIFYNLIRAKSRYNKLKNSKS
jgi:glycosyltransferase involved in cell wall biosynthesis